MKLRNLFYLLFILFIASCTPKEDIATITRAENLLDISPDSALIVLHQVKNTESLSRYYKMKYSLIGVLGKYKAYQDVKQDTFIFKVADYFNKRRNQNDKALANYAAASVLNENEKYTDAMTYYKNAEKVLENSDNYLMKGIIYDNIAYLYNKQLMYTEAIKYYETSLNEYSKFANNEKYQINDLIFLGTEYLLLNQTEKALSCYNKAFNLSDKIGDKNNQSVILNNIGLIYQEKKEFFQAIKYFKKAVNLRISNKESYYKNVFNLALNYLNINNIDSARFYNNILIHSLDSTTNLQYKSAVTYYLMNYYKKLDDYKQAFYYSTKRYTYEDELFKKNQSKALIEAEKRFDYTYESNKRLEAENKTAIFGRTVAILALVIVIFILLFFLYRTKTKNILLKNENERKNLQTEHQQKIWSEYFYSYIASANKEIMNTIYKLSINSLIKDNEKLSTLLDQTNKEFQSNLLNQQKKLLNTDNFYEITNVDKEQAALLNDNEKMLLSLLCCQLTREQISVMLNTTTESIRVRTIKLTQKLAEKAIKSNFKQ